MVQPQQAKAFIRRRKSKFLQNTILHILGGVIIGILATLIFKFVGGRFF